MNKGYQQFFIENLDDVFNEHHQDFFVNKYELKASFKILMYWDLIADRLLVSTFKDNSLTLIQKNKVFKKHITQHLQKSKNLRGKYLIPYFNNFKRKLDKFQNRTCDVLFYVSSLGQLKSFQNLVSIFEEQKLKVKYIYEGNNIEIINLIETKNIFNPLVYQPKFIISSFSKKYPFFTNVFLRLEQCVLFSKCKILIVSEGDAIQHRMLDEIARKNNIKTICLQWGYFGTEIPKMGWHNMQYDLFLCWGLYFKTGYKFFSPNLNIVNVGHHNLDNIKVAYKIKPTVLVALQQPLRPFIEKIDIVFLLDSIIEYAENYDKIDFIIRSHPSDEINESYLNRMEMQKNIFFHDSKKVNLNESLSGVWFCLSICSTLTLEGIAKGVVPIYFALDNKEFYAQKQLSSYNSRLLIKEILEIENLVKDFNEIKDELHISDFFSAIDIESVLKIKEVIS